MTTSIHDTCFAGNRPGQSRPPAPENHSACRGWCRSCRREHSLPTGRAREQAGALFDRLTRTGTIAAPGSAAAADPRLATASLFGKARGKMFGVLECLAADGTCQWLFAFSGQYNGQWLVPGWAPPLFDPAAYQRINEPGERQVKALGSQLAALPASEPDYRKVAQARRRLSQELMVALHELYRIPNFRGEDTSLTGAVGDAAGKPTGIGDCCAPKLLGQAVARKLAPISLAEFYFGRSNRSGCRQHGCFYPPCSDKCLPLLGFMLCGAEERRNAYGG
ncbi:MAG: hypothetical protein KQH59_10105 [Desulfobulbaceae bacterium]|nr:hypothetical protein [Desulfobulbaceae bacterium]